MKLVPYVILILFCVGAFFYIKMLGKIECENKQKNVIIEAQNNRAKVNHEVKNINRDTIIQRLDDGGWLRND